MDWRVGAKIKIKRNKKFRPAQPKAGLGKNLAAIIFSAQEEKTPKQQTVYACVIVQSPGLQIHYSIF